MDVVNTENKFNRALRLLDLGKIDKGLGLLTEIIIDAKKENNSLFFIRASCVLGELLFSTGEISEAKKHLLNVVNTPYQNDVVDYEKSIASEILGQIE